MIKISNNDNDKRLLFIDYSDQKFKSNEFLSNSEKNFLWLVYFILLSKNNWFKQVWERKKINKK